MSSILSGTQMSVLAAAGLVAVLIVGLVAAVRRDIFPYLLVGVLGLEYFGSADADSPLTVPKMGFVILALVQLLSGRWRIRLHRASMVVPMALYVAYFALSIMWSLAPERSVIRATTLIALLATLTLVASSINESEAVHRFLRAFVLYALVNAVVAVVQVTRGIQVIEDNIGGRVGGLAVNPTEGAFYMGLGLLITLGYHLEPGFARKWLSSAVVRYGLLAILSIGLLITGSRGGLLALFVALGFLLFSARHKALRAHRGSFGRFLGALLVAGLIVFSMPDSRQLFLNRLLSTGEDQLGNRLVIWEQVLGAVAQRPLLGSGLNSASIATARYEDSYTYSAHNVILTAMLDGGIFGFFALLLVAWAVARAFRRLYLHPLPEIGVPSRWLMALFVFAVCIMMGHDLGMNKLLWVMVGLVEGFVALTVFAPAPGHRPLPPRSALRPRPTRHAQA